ncbi:helix-turn-helix transcriptional regulator [uncultured Mailhella sp.]|uniref:helix-turn-helix domain-containing protein n=1 Tax=uncultured Mailhella sp. TaxID=1981031 RepID=UPI0025F8FBE0|nr:helix-turn-helix transcriptional regulator [uncultured Mailhella sp.]
MSRKNKEPLAIIVGANISAKRKRKGMNQVQLAEQLGIGPDSLSRIESGITAPKFQTLEKIAQVLECPVAELFLYNEEGVVLDITKNFSDTETAMSEIIILAEKIIKVAKCKK